VDVHEDLLVAGIVDDTAVKEAEFEYSLEGIESIKAWLRENDCKHVVMESTGVYWVPLYTALEEAGFHVVLANAYHVKSIPGRVTDKTSSEWLAKLLRSELVNPSYVPERGIRELRELTRFRVKLVQARTAFKNRCHKILRRVNIRLGSRLKDIFGKAGMEILEGLINGKTIEDIIDQSQNKRLKNRREEIVSVVRGTLSQVDMVILGQCVDMVKRLNQMIARLDDMIRRLVCEDDLRLLLTVPGVDEKAVILAEIGDVKRFEDGKSLVSWAGLAPSVHESAGETRTGGITKKGSKWLRRIMVQVAHVAKRVKNSQLRAFYLRVEARRGKKTAVVALARKILIIIHHILVNREPYVEEGFKKRLRLRASKHLGDLSLEDMAEILRSAGYLVSPLSD
jgi:transposase